MLNEPSSTGGPEVRDAAGGAAPTLDSPAGPRPFLTRLSGLVFYLPFTAYFAGLVWDVG